VNRIERRKKEMKSVLEVKVPGGKSTFFSHKQANSEDKETTLLGKYGKKKRRIQKKNYHPEE
jgi:hypothetical protein